MTRWFIKYKNFRTKTKLRLV